MSSEESPETPDQDGQDLLLTDPKVMRALAHPVRMALIDLLSVRDVTATQASEVLGESPANCAFHLRTLAKYGFCEEAGGGKGRERPWRIKHRSISISSHRMEDPQAKVAAKTLGRIWEDRVLARIRDAYARDSWPEDWEDAATSSSSRALLTKEEARQLARDTQALIDKYRERHTKPEVRPPGAKPVEFDFFVFPMTELAVADERWQSEAVPPKTHDIS
jgi:Helix-turn-helix domain